ncbi:unnamed protein product [Pylaiella littoralis]
MVLISVVDVDDIFAVGKRERCDKFGKDLNKSVPVKNLGELRWYSGCLHERNKETGGLTISQQTYTEELAAEFGVEWGKSVPVPDKTKISEFRADEVNVTDQFRELVGSLMWLPTMTRPDLSNAVRAVFGLREENLLFRYFVSEGNGRGMQLARICGRRFSEQGGGQELMSTSSLPSRRVVV